MENKDIVLLFFTGEKGYARDVASQLAEENYSHIFVQGASEGYKTILEKKPDMIFLDMNTKDLPGIDICRFLKLNPLTKDIPVILVSDCTMKEEIAEGFKAGCVDFLIKPWNKEGLIARVKTRLNSKVQLEILKQKVDNLDKTYKEMLTWLENISGSSEGVRESNVINEEKLV